MKGKDLIEYIKENGAEDHTISIITNDGTWLDVKSIGINPETEKFGLSNQ